MGAILGGVARSKHAQAVDEPVHRDAIALQDEASTLATAATVSLITGGVVTAVGVSLGVVGLVTDDGGGTEVTLRVFPGHVGLSGTF